jgi:hypothetical protein
MITPPLTRNVVAEGQVAGVCRLLYNNGWYAWDTTWLFLVAFIVVKRVSLVDTEMKL